VSVLGSELTDDLLTLALIAGVSVSALSLVVLVVERSTRRRPPPTATPALAPGVVATPQSAVALARARAVEAAARERVDHAHVTTPVAGTVAGTVTGAPSGPPTPGRPAGRSTAPTDGARPSTEPTIEEVRDLVDHLLRTNPRFLAEVITRWIHVEPTDSERST
jgi:hypothetical protein